MVLSLTHLGYNGDTLTEHWLNMLGLTAILVGIVTAIMVGMLTDRIKGNIKMLILALLTGGKTIPCITFLALQLPIEKGLLLLPPHSDLVKSVITDSFN